jgi:hypothetical protein
LARTPEQVNQPERKQVRFKILMAVSMKTAIFEDVALCGLVDINQYFMLTTLMMEAVSSSEMSVNIYHTTQ